jgi:hypothetical protein
MSLTNVTLINVNPFSIQSNIAFFLFQVLHSFFNSFPVDLISNNGIILESPNKYGMIFEAQTITVTQTV